MKSKSGMLKAVLIASALTAAAATASLAAQAAEEARADALGNELSNLQREWADAKFGPTDKKRRKAAFAGLLEHAAALSDQHPNDPEVLAWEGIVLSTYAGEVGGMSAMKYAKAARDVLHRAEALDPAALDGGIYASLGALYAKVPGGIIGFGDDALAEAYFRKALAVDPDSLDANFFYGEFLLERGDHSDARVVLGRALSAPPAQARPVFDAGRRAEIRALLAEAAAHDRS